MSNIVEKNIETIANVLSKHSPNIKERSDAAIALGRLSVWAEAAMTGRGIIEVRGNANE